MPEPEATLSVAAELRNLEVIRRFVRLVADEAGAPTADAWDLVQAVDEAATNVIIHGYRGAAGEIEVRARQQHGGLVLRLLDTAPVFDPTGVPSPDLDLPLDRRPLGKMGVHLTRELTDEVRHRARGSTGNELTVVKRFTTDGGRREPVEQEAR
jgi:serine/threonine-protein kinase RsbW